MGDKAEEETEFLTTLGMARARRPQGQVRELGGLGPYGSKEQRKRVEKLGVQRGRTYVTEH